MGAMVFLIQGTKKVRSIQHDNRLVSDGAACLQKRRETGYLGEGMEGQTRREVAD
jgi:hypothetical protein